MDTHPSEIVVISVNTEFSPFNLNLCVDKSIVERIDVDELYWESDLIDYMKIFFGKEMIIDDISIDTKVWDLV